MIFRTCLPEKFAKIINDKKVFCFGASIMPHEICAEYPEICLEQKTCFFVDNDQKKQGTLFMLKGEAIPIISAEQLAKEMGKEDILLITSKYYALIYEQLSKIQQLNDKDCYIWPAIAPHYKTDKDLNVKLQKHKKKEMLIPKKIHYCWFGESAFSELEKRCVASWHRICPDYEIIRWDESNYDVSKIKYMKEAYETKKWGFVPDYARLDIIYQNGGIYLDTDVEVIRPFDELLNLEGFAGFESKSLCALGLGFGAKAGHRMLRVFMDSYRNRPFKKESGGLDMTASPFIQTEVLEKMGLRLNNQLQQINQMVILPAECLSPDNNMIPHITENTFSLHHFAGSWTTNKNREELFCNRRFAEFLRSRS